MMDINIGKRYGKILENTKRLAKTYCETHPSYELEYYRDTFMMNYNKIDKCDISNKEKFLLLLGWLLQSKMVEWTDDTFAPPSDIYYRYLYDYMILAEELHIKEETENV